ncbi:MAG: glycoside hydrolase family 5 protein [Lachnospiraceae bacterium]|nr:glycoside hydrolase family 5 protein [Lachnospiraceae bacterium]
MRRLKMLALSLSMAMIMGGCAVNDEKETTTAEQTTVAPETTTEEVTTEAETTTVAEITGGFQVDGTKLLDANGEEFVLRGINEAHSWFATQDGVSLKGISETGSNCVRIVLGCGIQYNRDDAIVVSQLINICKNLNMIAIVEVHDGTGDNEAETLETIADYWIDVKDALIGNEAYVILNIANEWYGSWSGTEKWAQAYESVIPRIREAGIKNTIMVDAAGWGQYSQCIADYGMDVFESDPDANTMFSIHMYGAAGKNETTITKGLTGATDQNLCVCVGEFGYKHSDGDVDEAFIMQYCTENNIGYLGWSWKGNGGGVEYLDIAEYWNGSDLSDDWGDVLVSGEYGIKNTSKICSVFE